MDKLETLFELQQDLNEFIFRKRGDDPSLWDRFIGREATPEQMRDWTLNFMRALIHEAVELESSCNWKWWSDDPPIDLQNARVEIIDLWHFLISASMVVGLGPDEILDVYRQKHAVNRQRQESGYSQTTKTEDDNRSIRIAGASEEFMAESTE